jgi:FlaG/FlaF family flagellin (archaellin)
LKLTSYLLPAAAVVVVTAAAILASTTAPVNAAQQPAGQAAAPAQQAHGHATPTNLQVLPKNLTGEQVHEIMHKWEDELGANCGTCHAADPKNLAPNGKPRLNFADDSKPEKATARKMFQMTEQINMQYISKIENSGDPVSCGTCHRGHLGPQPFKPDADHDDHDHDHPGAAAPKN